MAAEHDQIPEQALAWAASGEKVALATVVETWGSAPRPVGAQLAINGAAEMMGSVSGGCVEGAVVAEALEAVEDGHARVLEFGVSDDEAFAVGLACGGRIRVLVEPVGVGDGLPLALLEALVAARAARRPVALAVDLETWAHALVAPDGDALSSVAGPRFLSDKSGFEGDLFLGIHNPPLRMVVVGAVHIAQPLMAMARLAGCGCRETSRPQSPTCRSETAAQRRPKAHRPRVSQARAPMSSYPRPKPPAAAP
ncbi:MAG: XdhC family protein, partial [Pseudomonadota bacterium]